MRNLTRLSPSAFRSCGMFAICALSSFAGSVSAQCFRVWEAGPEGVDGNVKAMASWDPDGAGPLPPWLVIAGDFVRAGTTQTPSGVAAWDGTTFRSLGPAFDAPASSLAVLNGQLVAAGAFTTSGGASCPHIARWNPAGNGGVGAWEPLGLGVSGFVSSLAVDGSTLYVGGSFQAVGGGSAQSRFAASFTAASGWSGFQSAPAAPVEDIAVAGGAIYVRVHFSSPQPGGDEQIFRWNPASHTWGNVSGLFAYAGAMAGFGANLFYSGLTRETYDQENDRQYTIRKFDGAATAVAAPYHSATSYTVHNGQLTALGFQRRIGDEPSYSSWLASWTGSAFVDIGPSPHVDHGLIHSHGGTLYLAGPFLNINGVAASGLAHLFGVQWRPLTTGFDAAARCLTMHQGRIYVGGDFNAIGSVIANKLASSDGTSWSGATTMNGSVTALRSHDFNQFAVSPSLIVGGTFTQIGSTTANRIAARDPATLQWAPLGSGLNAQPLAFTAVSSGISNVDLVVGGAFTTAGGNSANRIARWNGSSWSTFGAGANADVMALAVYNGQIVMGGAFTTAGGQPRGFIARWDPSAGGSWQPLGSGTNGTVRALTVLNSVLYAGGDFTTAGGNTANRVAAWNGSSWSAVGDGFNGTVHTLVAIDGTIAAGGTFTASGAAEAYRMAQWNGVAWREIGSFTNSAVGADGPVLAMLANGQDLHAAGQFQTVDGQHTPFYARAAGSQTITAISQPQPVEVCPGDSASMTFVATSGFFTPTYQWRRNGVPLSDGASPSGAVYNGTGTSTLLIDNAQAGAEGLYSCRATSICGQTVDSDSVVLAAGDCCPADLGSQGGLPGPDGVLDNNDFIVFIDYFFNHDPRADLGVQGGARGSDGTFDNNDFVVFIDLFFQGC